MSTLKTNNIEHLDASSPSIQLDVGGGMVVAGVITATSMDLSGSDGFTVGTGASVSSPATNVLVLGTNNAERVRITSGGDVNVAAGGSVFIGNGNLVFSTSGTGIDFSATGEGSGTMTSELLDDYEEGTFTPVLEDNSGTSTHTYTQQIGQYTKIGNTVYIHLRVSINSLGSTGSGSIAVVSGLPFTIPTHGTNYMTANVTFVDGFADNFVPKMATFRSGETQMSLWRITDEFYRITGTIGPGRVNASSDLEINGFYFVD